MSQDLPKLLLFDDDPDTGDMVVDKLTDDFEVTFCTTESQIRDKIQPDRFCVIVCDVSIQNSNKTGYKIIDEIRQDYGIKDVPVVVYSAVRDVTEIKKNEGSYYAAYIEKGPTGWGQKLLSACLKARAKRSVLTFVDVYLKSLEDHLDDPLDVGNFSPDAEIMGITDKLTVRTLLDQLKNKELDKDSERVYREAIENYYDGIKDNFKTIDN